MSFRAGRTSSRAGGPGAVHALVGVVAAGVVAAGLADGTVVGAGGAASPSRCTSRNVRVRRTLAVQF
jgi:hypothetical protein